MNEPDILRAAEALAEIQGYAASGFEEKAAIPSAVLDVDGRDVTTIFSIDGAIDQVGDITRSTAFARSIAHRPDRIPHMFMHDLTKAPLGRIVSFRELRSDDLSTNILEEYPDATGGMSCISRFVKSQSADEVLAGMRDGIPFGASFGYQVLKARPSETKKLPSGKPARILEEVRLLEVSTCIPGAAAHPGTRSRLGKVLALLEEYKSTLEAIKAGRRHSEADMESLRQGVELARQIMQLFDSLGADNIQLLEPASPAQPARTSTVELIADIRSIIGGSNEEIRVHAASGKPDAAIG